MDVLSASIPASAFPTSSSRDFQSCLHNACEIFDGNLCMEGTSIFQSPELIFSLASTRSRTSFCGTEFLTCARSKKRVSAWMDEPSHSIGTFDDGAGFSTTNPSCSSTSCKVPNLGAALRLVRLCFVRPDVGGATVPEPFLGRPRLRRVSGGQQTGQ
jgi:hypothetical protein